MRRTSGAERAPARTAGWFGPGDGIVVAQMTAIAALAWPGRRRWRLPGPLAALAGTAVAAGTALGVTAGLRHRPRLTPSVHPPAGASLITDGPYAVSRNPIYAGLLLAGGGTAALRGRVVPVLAWAGLLATLVVKVRREEGLLRARFGEEFAEYHRRTPRFVGPVGR